MKNSHPQPSDIQPPKRAKGRANRRTFFDRFSDKVSRGAGRPITSVTAFMLIVVWGISGPIFDYSETWQLIINTTTTIITFLMVFIIQQSQNREGLAVQLKLNELIACHKRASNRLVDVEALSADELEVLRKFYVKLADLAEDSNGLHTTHSIDEAEKAHKSKHATRTRSKKTGSH